MCSELSTSNQVITYAQIVKCIHLINHWCEMATVNVTVGMTPEMLQSIDRDLENRDMSRAEYIRRAVRNCEGTPFESPDATLDELKDAEKGAA